MQFPTAILIAFAGLVASVAATSSECTPCGADNCSELTKSQEWSKTRAAQTVAKTHQTTYTYNESADKPSAIKVTRSHRKGSGKSSLKVVTSEQGEQYVVQVDLQPTETIKYLITGDCTVELKDKKISSVALFTKA